MNILQGIETGGPGGAEHVLIRLSQKLAARGHSLGVFLLKSGWLKDRIEEAGLPLTVHPLRRPLDRRFAANLSNALASRKVDVFHSHEFGLALYGRFAAKRLKIRHVATAHGANFTRGAKRKLVGRCLFRPGRGFRLVAVSRDLARRLSKDLWIRRDAIEVVPNGIDLPPELPPVPRVSGTPLVVVAVGNLYAVKNHALMIRAVALTRGWGIPVELDVLGRGEEEASLRRLVSELGLEHAVRLHGFRSDVDSFLAKAHVFVSSSLSEGQPLSFLEAMARGLPIVASRVGGVSEMVEDGVEGLLFESGDAEGAAHALRKVAEDDDLRMRMATHARARAGAHHSLESMVDHYERIYGSLEGT